MTSMKFNIFLEIKFANKGTESLHLILPVAKDTMMNTVSLIKWNAPTEGNSALDKVNGPLPAYIKEQNFEIRWNDLITHANFIRQPMTQINLGECQHS